MALYKPLLDELGITYLQYITLMILWKDGEQKVSDICSKTDIDVGTISPMLKRMEKNNLLVRTRDSIDERIVKISLTLKGEEMKEKAVSVPHAISSCFVENSVGDDKQKIESIANLFDSFIDIVKSCDK